MSDVAGKEGEAETAGTKTDAPLEMAAATQLQLTALLSNTSTALLHLPGFFKKPEIQIFMSISWHC